jgi:hypothetical protein
MAAIAFAATGLYLICFILVLLNKEGRWPGKPGWVVCAKGAFPLFLLLAGGATFVLLLPL